METSSVSYDAAKNIRREFKKKTLFAILSALIVVCCFFGCGPVSGSGSGSGDVNFSPKSTTLSVAYPVSDVTIVTGDDVIGVSASADGSELTFTSKKSGDAKVIIYSDDYAKIATVNVAVSSIGYVVIEGDSSENSQILNTMTYEGNVLTPKKSYWVDDPHAFSQTFEGTTTTATVGYYEFDDNTDDDGDWYMLVKGDVVYLMEKKHVSDIDPNYYFWKFARGLILQDDDTLDIDWTSYGTLQQNISGKYFTASDEHKTYVDGEDVDVDTLGEEDLTYLITANYVEFIKISDELIFNLMDKTAESYWNETWRVFK